MAFSLDEALGMSLADEADESIHVDIDTRQVTIPESQQVFGVESDEDVEVKHIVIDGRYADGTDLSTFTFRVNYQNANGDKGTYLVTELKVNDSSIEFDWVIGRQVVAYKGTIAFIVCAYTIDSSSVIQNEWNSTLGKGTVLEGLEVSEFDFGDDIVRQLASILSDVNAAQASAKASADEAYKSKTEVVALGKEQQAAIEKKGKATLATIPEDYTQVSNDVSQLKEATAKLKDGKISKFYASSQGGTNLPDSDDGRIMDLKLYGKSEQKQYSGKNLFPPVAYSGNVSNLQIDAADGAVHLKGTPNDQVNSAIIGAWSASSPTIFTLPAGTYTLSGFGEWLATPRLNLVYVENGELISLSGNKTATFDKETNFIAVFVYANANAALDITFKPMIEKGSTATDYEPYVGGIPSPNPEYPQEIKSVVKPVVKVMGENLLKTINWETQTLSGVTIEKTSDTVFKISGTATDDVNVNSSWGQNIKVPAQSYLLCKILHGSCPAGSKVIFFTSSYGSISSEIGGVSHLQTSALACGLVRFFIKKGANINCTVGLSLQMDASTDYQPYTESTATMPYTLNAIPVTSGGNVTIDGQQYIADYVDVERGKLVRMVHAASLTDTLTFAFEKKTSSGYYRYNISNSVPNNNKYDANLFPPNSYENWGLNAKALCSGFKNIKTTDSSNFNESGDSMGIFIEGSRGVAFQSTYEVDELKEKFPMQLLYALKTPTETDLTADEIAAFKTLVSHYPVTNVSTTSDQLGGYTVFDYPISLAKGYDYLKTQLGDTRDYLYGIDLMTAEAYVNSEYAAALAEIEV